MGDKRERTKAMIISKSLPLFSQKGFAKVTMKDICDATGMSRGGLYSHFSSTIEIFEEILKFITQNDSMEFARGICEERPAVEMLDNALESMESELIDSDSTLERAIYEFAIGVDKDFMQELNYKAEEKWKSLIEYGISRGEFKEVDIDGVIGIILYVYQGIRMWSDIVDMRPVTIKAVLKNIRNQLVMEENNEY